MKKVSCPVSKFITIVSALLGVTGVWLPWGKVLVGDQMGKFGSGMFFFEGWMVFLSLASAFVFSLTGCLSHDHAKISGRISFWAGVVSGLFSLIFLLRYHFMGTGLGIWICLIMSVVIVVIGYKNLKAGKREIVP